MASYYTNDYKNTAELLGLDSKSSVKKIQQQLIDSGYNIGSSGVDGVWGPATDAAYWQYVTPSGSGGGNSIISSMLGGGASTGTGSDSSGTLGSLGSGILGLLGGGQTQKTEDQKKADAVADMDAEIKRYFDQVLSGYNLPTRTADEIRSQIEAILNPSYLAAIKQRQDATAANRAMIDLDAYSRGMGASTWDTDAKMRESQKEAEDLVTLAGNYQSAIAQSILDQMNRDQDARLTATNNAYSLALQLQQMAKAAEDAVGSDVLSSLGGGGSSVSTYDLLTGGKSSSGGSSSGKSSSSTPSGLKAAYDAAKTSTTTTQAVDKNQLNKMSQSYKNY